MAPVAAQPWRVIQNLLEGDPLTWAIFLVTISVLLGVTAAFQIWVVLPRDRARIREDADAKGFRLFRPRAGWLPPAGNLVWHLTGGLIGSQEGHWYKVRYRTADGEKQTAWVLVPHPFSDRQYLSWYPIETDRRD